MMELYLTPVGDISNVDRRNTITASKGTCTYRLNGLAKLHGFQVRTCKCIATNLFNAIEFNILQIIATRKCSHTDAFHRLRKNDTLHVFVIIHVMLYTFHSFWNDILFHNGSFTIVYWRPFDLNGIKEQIRHYSIHPSSNISNMYFLDTRESRFACNIIRT